jgi:hypothetical protein
MFVLLRITATLIILLGLGIVGINRGLKLQEHDANSPEDILGRNLQVAGAIVTTVAGVGLFAALLVFIWIL